MEKKSYSDNNFENLTNDLHNLPKIQTPPDFEFKLMSRIQNGNFNSKFKEEKEFTFGRFFKPAFSLVVVMLTFIIILNINDNQSVSPLIDTPTKLNKINSGSLNEVKKIDQNKTADKITKNDKSQKSSFALKSPQNMQFSGKTIDIDKAMKQNQNVNQQNEFGVLAGSEQFSGFGVRVPAQKGEMDSMKSKIDSIRKASKK